ncbi:hypothetical protein EXW14_06990 [Enterococcus faecium]|nr:hypothetical protein [Enterococcus faecium]MDO7994913.1 hypothetical protein [Enterococcus faecium]MDO8154048.1 hypothetical protein [Enterococcus faecium]MDO8163087.1 hypothetical protein [Enterococcus faecium]
MVHSDSDLILHNSSVLIDKEPKFKSKLLYSLIYLLCEIILLTTFLEFSSLNKTTVFGFHPAYCN